MVGAAHFVGSLGEDGHADAFEPGRDAVNDALTPVLNAAVFREVPRLVAPIDSYERDRGQILESEFEKITPQLAQSFAKFADGEPAGWRPSLVFTPILIQDGRRPTVPNPMFPHQTPLRTTLQPPK